MVTLTSPIDVLYAKLGDKVKENVSLAPYTSARIGGPADVLIIAESADELAHTVNLLRKQGLDYIMLGGGRGKDETPCVTGSGCPVGTPVDSLIPIRQMFIAPPRSLTK